MLMQKSALKCQSWILSHHSAKDKLERFKDNNFIFSAITQASIPTKPSKAIHESKKRLTKKTIEINYDHQFHFRHFYLFPLQSNLQKMYCKHY